ncbi:MAG: BON domain-containing protein [Proteobacteria bacterium]|nr:BON domain-containing protein [Pseudomonadota bacterium]
MSNEDGAGGETYGRAGAYNVEPGQSVGEFGNEGQVGGVPPEDGAYTGQTGTGYGRTAGGRSPDDDRMREEITAKLDADPFLDATHIDVWVAEGEARLTGTVSARSDKRRAEDLAKTVSGVARVHDQLTIQDASKE